jgi:hypothetical protein
MHLLRSKKFIVKHWKPGNKGRIHVSEIYSAVEDNADAQEIADQYMLEKEILPANHANKETLASELLTRLINRFRELEDEVSKLSSQFTQFVMLPEEKVSTGIDRLNGIVQKLNQHGQRRSWLSCKHRYKSLR